MKGKSARKKNLIKGRRLKELINRKYHDLPERNQISAFISELQQKGSNVGKEMISMYINGNKNISEVNIELFSEIFGTDVGYLSGDDNFISEEYAEYMAFKRLDSMDHIIEYSQLFKGTGLFLSADAGDVIINGKNHVISDPCFTLTRMKEEGNIRKEFTEKAMRRYYDAILEYINKYFDDYDPDDMDSMKGGDASD